MKNIPALVMILCSLLLAFASNILPLHAQQGIIVEGRTAAGVTVPIRVDASGGLNTTATYSGTQAVNATEVGTSSLLYSSVTTSTLSPVQVTAANAGRKVIHIQNTSTTGNICYDTISPVSCTGRPFLPPGASYFQATNAPTNTFFVIGQTASISPVVAIGEGQ